MATENFDQFIKGIANSKEQPFKEAHWSSFAKTAGIKGVLLSGKIALLTIGTGIVIAGGGIFMLYRSDNPAEPSNFTKIHSEQPETGDIDAYSFFEETDNDTISEKKSVVRTKPIRKKEEPQVLPQTTTTPEKPEKIEKKEGRYRLRQVFINTDTITDPYY